MKVDLEELKRLHASDDPHDFTLFSRVLDKTFHAIVAQLEAAQRLRDAAADMVKRVNANQSPEGLLTSDQWKPVAWLDLHRAVAAFDKEQK